MTGDVNVSVVLPVYNEAGHASQEVKRIAAALDRSQYSYEIVVVDDGSTDGSFDELAALDLSTVRLIRFRANQGSGAARRAGTRAAKGDVVVWTDADMTYPNEDIARLVDDLAGYDQVIGVRRRERGSARPARVAAKWTMRRLAGYLAEQDIPDLNSGFRAFRRDVGEQFLHQLPQGFSCVSTMTMAFLMNGYSVRYVPIEYETRAGTSKFHWWRDTVRYLQQIVRMIMRYQPLRVFVPLGLTLFLLGAAKLVFDMVEHPVRVATNTLLILFAAFQLFAVGLVADLVVTTAKPLDLVEPAQE